MGPQLEALVRGLEGEDADPVTREHNRALAERLLERAEREAAREVCRNFPPLLSLPERLRRDVLARVGLGPGVLESPAGRREPGVPLRVVPPGPGQPMPEFYFWFYYPEDEEESATRREVVEVLEDEQVQYLMNGDGRRGGRGRAERLSAGLLRPGERCVRVYGSRGEEG
ncbi:hypothetical protein DXX99_09225 [Ammonifex thiophilus]|uniref:Uncharacterized protein n=1 Tax=Ammonifex thiophilus TaxID=444093 RepID=A0A3D8P3U4_9THEO|nr:hypothetical protein DXX99_09225 [Ammonifex thiophilus]